MRSKLVAVLAFLLASPLLAQDNRPPAPMAELKISTYQPKGAMPGDWRAFVSLYGKNLAPVEKQVFENKAAEFEKAQTAFEKDREATVKQALVDLQSPDRNKVLEARKRLVEQLQDFPSSGKFYQDSVSHLTPENAERFATMIYDLGNARSAWLAQSNTVLTEMKLDMGVEFQARDILKPELQEALDLRNALTAIETWKNEALASGTRREIQTMIHIMDFHLRHDGRAAQRIQERFRTIIGDDKMQTFSYKIYERMPQRPTIVK